MNTISTSIFSALLGVVLLSSCNRPTAYFQPSTREHFTSTVVDNTSTNSQAVVVATVPVATIATPTQQVTQATEALAQVDAVVRNDSKLAMNKAVQKRISRVRTLLASTSVKTISTPSETVASRKMNLMERMIMKKLNKKISKQLAPANPEKTMAVKGILALGAVVLIAGILLLALTSGTGATIGVIGIIAGLALLLIGLI